MSKLQASAADAKPNDYEDEGEYEKHMPQSQLWFVHHKQSEPEKKQFNDQRSHQRSLLPTVKNISQGHATDGFGAKQKNLIS